MGRVAHQLMWEGALRQKYGIPAGVPVEFEYIGTGKAGGKMLYPIGIKGYGLASETQLKNISETEQISQEELRAKEYEKYHEQLKLQVQQATGEYREPTIQEWKGAPLSPIRAQVMPKTPSASIPSILQPMTISQKVIAGQEYFKALPKSVAPPEPQLTTLGISPKAPSLFQKATQKVGEWLIPPSKIYDIRREPTPVEKGLLSWAYVTFPSKFGKAAKESEARYVSKIESFNIEAEEFGKGAIAFEKGITTGFYSPALASSLYEKYSKEYQTLKSKELQLEKAVHYQVPKYVELPTITAKSFAIAATTKVGLGGTFSLLGIGATTQRIIGGTMIAASVPPLITGFKQDPLRTGAVLAGGIAGAVFTPSPTPQPLTFTRARFMEKQWQVGANILETKGQLRIKQTTFTGTKEYIIPYESKGAVLIKGKTFAVSSKQVGAIFERGIGGLDIGKGGILAGDVKLKPPQVVSARSVIIGKLEKITATIPIKELGLTVEKVVPYSIARGGGILGAKMPKGIELKPFVAKTGGIEIATKESIGSIVYGKSMGFNVREIFIGGIKGKGIAFAVRGIAKKPFITARGLTFVAEGKIKGADLEGLGISQPRISTISKQIRRSIAGNIPQISKSILIPKTKTIVAPILPTGKSLRAIPKIEQIQELKTLTITPQKQIQMPKTIQIFKQIQIPSLKTIQMPRQIQMPKLAQIPAITQIQIPKEILMPREIQISRTIQIQKIIGISTIPLMPILPTTYMPPLIIPPLFFFGRGGGSLGKGIIKGKQPKRYTPSFRAILFGIKGKQPKKPLTGLELRPITKGFSWYNLFGRKK